MPTHPARDARSSPEDKLVPFLGWFSLGLGVPQLIAPGAVNRLIGIHDDADSRRWQRIVGVRELAAAAGILGQSRPTEWVWARVAGDVKDLALLAAAFSNKRASTMRLAVATGNVVAITAVDFYTAVRLSRRPDSAAGDLKMRVKAAITVRATRDDVYRIWHDFQNLPRFMVHLESVQGNGNGRSHWKAAAPAGRTVEWDAQIVEDRPRELIAWRSVEGSDVDTWGSVRFTPAPGDRGTEIHVDMHYSAPGGKVGEIVAKLFGEEPTQQVKDDLRRFKQVMETGEVVRSEATPDGQHAGRLLRQRPAQPLEEPVATAGRTS